VITAMADRNIARWDKGTRTVLATVTRASAVSGPNDIVVKSDGAVYFTEREWTSRRSQQPAREAPS